jgi:hypothetical protein
MTNEKDATPRQAQKTDGTGTSALAAEHPWPFGEWTAWHELADEMTRVGVDHVTVTFLENTEYWLASAEDAVGNMLHWHGAGWPTRRG